MRRGAFKLILSAILLYCLSLFASSSQKVLTLNTTTGPPFTTKAQNGFLDLITAEAFRRVGLKFRFVSLPAERGLRNVDSGIDDGDLFRIKGLDKTYPNLVRVPETLYDMEFVAYSLDPNLKIKTWSDLNGLSVGIIRGWKILERNIKSRHLISVRNSDILFKMLKHKRVKVIVYARWMGLEKARAMGIPQVIEYLPSLAKRKMYIYLNKKHKHLVEPIARSLRQIKKEGLYEKLFKKTLAPLIKH